MLCDLGIFDGIDIALPSVVKACGRLKHAREGQQVHKQILQTHFKLDPFVLNALIRMYSELEELGWARQARLREMIKKAALREGLAHAKTGIDSHLEEKIKQLKSENNSWHQEEVNLEQRISQLLHEKASPEENSGKEMISVLSNENTRLRKQVYITLPDIVLLFVMLVSENGKQAS
ncbi:hypothetical protein Cgig2_008796 [Carnegiea gigantea]|uniref:Uncharacterized protein n=1 Tax=Carnegiea gigantea TaxID=171969 RepID=A0A9Q1JQT4_9CARY|nr:hypothetical protein Cgig2_008796 [Carnegiea gigantea]